MDKDFIIHDAHNVFESVPALDFIKKFIDAAPDCVRAYRCTYNPSDMSYTRTLYPKYDTRNVNKFIKYLTRTTGHMYIRMLMTMDEGRTCDYESMHAQILKPRGIRFGNDTLLWNSLQNNGLVEVDHFGKYRRKFFKLTALGKLVVDSAKKNDIAYRTLRHFMKFKDTLDESTLISTQINPETFNDMTPASYVSILEAILDTSSVLHEIGSYAYWLNKLVEALKKSDAFFNDFNCNEVNDWIKSHLSDTYVKRFNAIFQKIVKKYIKKAA